MHRLWLHAVLLKKPEDRCGIYEFECRDGEICFEDGLDADECPEVKYGTETIWNACAWHGNFDELKRRSIFVRLAARIDIFFNCDSKNTQHEHLSNWPNGGERWQPTT